MDSDFFFFRNKKTRETGRNGEKESGGVCFLSVFVFSLLFDCSSVRFLFSRVTEACPVVTTRATFLVTV